MWYKGNVAHTRSVERFDMPALKDDFTIGRKSDFLERESYEQGYVSGEKAGYEMGEQKARTLIDRLETLIKELRALRGTIIKEVEPQCIELAMGIAKKIVMKELTLNPKDIVNMTKEALMKLERTGQITIKINPALYELFQKHKPELTSIYPDIAFDVDPSVSRFGSVVMGPVEDVVTDLDEQLKNLIKDRVCRSAGA